MKTKNQLFSSMDSSDEAPSITVYIKCITLCSAMGGFLSTYNLAILSGTMLLIKKQYHLNTIWHELIVSTSIATASVASFVAGFLNDWYGKKPVLMAGSFLFAVGSIVLGGAFRKEVFVVGQMITGVAVGLTYATAPRYIADFAPPDMRGRLVGIYSCFAALGNAASGLSAGVFSYYPWGWRGMFVVSIVPAIIQCVWFCFLPESPMWLISHGRGQEGQQVTEKAHGEYTSRVELGDGKFADTGQEGQNTEDESLVRRVLQTVPVRRALLVGCGIQFVQQFSGVNAVQLYNSSIVQMAGTKSDVVTLWLTSVVFSCSAVGHFISFCLVDKIGRRILLLTSMAGISFSLLLLSTSFYLTSIRSVVTMTCLEAGVCATYRSCSSCIVDKGCGYCYVDDGALSHNASCLSINTLDTQYSLNGRCSESKMRHSILEANTSSHTIWEVDICPSNYRLMTLAGMMTYVLSFGLGLGPVSWLINAEIYPTWASSFCNGCATATNWASNLIVSMTFLSLTHAITNYGTFLLYFAVSVSGLVSVYFVLPETKDKPLDEVTYLFNEPLCPCQRNSSSSYEKLTTTNHHPDVED